MKYKDVDFRVICNNFCIFSLSDNLRKKLKKAETTGLIKNIDKAKSILTYGYIDHSAGLTLELLATCMTDKNGTFQFFDVDNTTLKIRIGMVKEDDFMLYDDIGDKLKTRYKDKVNMILSSYKVSKDVENIRKIEILDSLRSKEYPDDVLVVFQKDEYKEYGEACWVRIEKTEKKENYFSGILLNEPEKDFGIHNGEKVFFHLEKQDDGSYMGFADLKKKATRKKAKDKLSLKELIKEYNKDKSSIEKLLAVINVLMTQNVYLLYHALFGKDDINNIEQFVKNLDNLDDLKGKEFTTSSPIRLKLELLKTPQGEFFFPMYSSPQEIPDTEGDCSIVEKHFLEALILAKNNKHNISAVIIDPFSESIILGKDIFELLDEQIKIVEKLLKEQK